MKGPIQSLEIVYFVHSTEDPARVEGALGEILGERYPAEIETMEGHHGNKIVRFTLHLTGEQAYRAFLSLLAATSGDVKKEILAEVESHIDEHSALFVRLDKQLLVAGKVALGAEDAVRIKVKPRVFLLKGGAPEFYRGFLGRA